MEGTRVRSSFLIHSIHQSEITCPFGTTLIQAQYSSSVSLLTRASTLPGIHLRLGFRYFSPFPHLFTSDNLPISTLTSGSLHSVPFGSCPPSGFTRLYSEPVQVCQTIWAVLLSDACEYHEKSHPIQPHLPWLLFSCAFPRPSYALVVYHAITAKVHRWSQCFALLTWAFYKLNPKASMYLPRHCKASKLRVRS